MTIYIAGKIRGTNDYQTRFAQAADQLRAQGYATFNPAAANQEGQPLNRIMAYLLPQLCECDAIAMQKGWWRSGGARIEWLLAKYIGIRIIYL